MHIGSIRVVIITNRCIFFEQSRLLLKASRALVFLIALKRCSVAEITCVNDYIFFGVAEVDHYIFWLSPINLDVIVRLLAGALHQLIGIVLVVRSWYMIHGGLEWGIFLNCIDSLLTMVVVIPI